jgi:hypothetical protein
MVGRLDPRKLSYGAVVKSRKLIARNECVDIKMMDV